MKPKKGKMHSIRSPGNRRLFDVGEVRRLLEAAPTEKRGLEPQLGLP
ncbi:hypothetical protein [Kyrpidia tusciae]|nr:hypothetical protein [Kyrpidia tusciae]